MPSSNCCTNCRTKYSLLNREAGCSNCAMSFCKKCLSYRAMIPNLSNTPITVCYDCYQKIEAKKMKSDAVITSTPLPPLQSNSSGQKNWWGDGLPPPSFRSAYSQGGQNNVNNFNKRQPQQITKEDLETKKLEERNANLRSDQCCQCVTLTTSELEQRLADLRGVDVELIRNPGSLFSNDNKRELPTPANPADLIEMATDRARIEENERKMKEEEWKGFEERRKRLFENDEQPIDEDNPINRESMISGVTDFSEATKEEMTEINKLLNDAESRVNESRKQEEKDAAEMRTLMKNSRQKSLDAMQWNDKITKEIGGFWNRQNDKQLEYNDDEDDKSLDEETFKKILYEAENTEIEPEKPATSESQTSPKKKGFFDKLFRKDSKQ